MAFSDADIAELKNQLKEQVQQLPADRKNEAEKQIDSMSNEAIEEMVRQQQNKTPVYRMIVQGEIQSVKVEETPEALAVMEIRPASRGHVIIIPKNAIVRKEDIPNSIQEFSNKLADKMKDRFQAKDVKKTQSMKFGEMIIDLIPDYGAPIKSEGQREQAERDELEKAAQEIQKEIIKMEKKVEIIKPEENAKKDQAATIVKLKRRIP